eukprot:9084079-Pyramimonas_sp.AAC.1
MGLRSHPSGGRRNRSKSKRRRFSTSSWLGQNGIVLNCARTVLGSRPTVLNCARIGADCAQLCSD